MKEAQRQQQKSLRNKKRNVNSRKKGLLSPSPSAAATATTTSKERRRQEKRGSTMKSTTTDSKTKKTTSENAWTKQSAKSDNKEDITKEPLDTFTARMKAAKKLKEVKEGVATTKSWNSAGEARQMKFKPGQSSSFKRMVRLRLRTKTTSIPRILTPVCKKETRKLRKFYARSPRNKTTRRQRHGRERNSISTSSYFTTTAVSITSST